MNKFTTLATGIAIAVASMGAFAQTETPRVDKREANQQKRIGNGIKSGKVNSQEATNLEKRETSVQNREQKDMAKHNGHLTKAEQKGINRQQNRISKSIYKDKHNQ